MGDSPAHWLVAALPDRGGAAICARMSAPDARRRRLLFRALHRGTHENDLMIGGYVSERIELFSETEIDALEELLELPDTSLADWLTGPATHSALCCNADAACAAGACRGRGRGGKAMTVPVYGAPEGWDANLLARRAGEQKGVMLHVARDDVRVDRVAQQVAFFCADDRGAAVPGLGLPAVRSRVAKCPDCVRTRRHLVAAAGGNRDAAAGGDDGQRAGAAGAAAACVSRRRAEPGGATEMRSAPADAVHGG